MAQCRHLQREPRQDRRAVSEEGLEGLRRGPAPDTEVAGPERAGQIHDGSRDPALPRRPDPSRRPWRRRPGERPRRATSAGRRRWRRAVAASAAAAGQPRPTPKNSTTRSRSRLGGAPTPTRCWDRVGSPYAPLVGVNDVDAVRPGITFPLIPARRSSLYPPTVPSCRGAASWIRRRSSREVIGARAGGNPLSRAIATRVRPPSRGAVRETRRHYDRLCV